MGKGFNPINYLLSAPKSRMCVMLGLINLPAVHFRCALSTVRNTNYSVKTQWFVYKTKFVTCCI